MNPHDVVELKEGERVLSVRRNHWTVYWRGWVSAFLLIMAPFFLMVPLLSYRGYGLLVFLVLLVTGIVLLFRTTVEWRSNAFIVTTRRVIDVDQRGFFRRTVSEASYDRVQDVSYAVSGLWGAVLRCGSVAVQTAGSSLNLELECVPDPKGLHHQISEAVAATRAFVAPQDAGKVGALLEAAGSLDDAETRAVLLALREKIERRQADDQNARPSRIADGDLDWYADDEEGGKPV